MKLQWVSLAAGTPMSQDRSNSRIEVYPGNINFRNAKRRNFLLWKPCGIWNRSGNAAMNYEIDI